MLSIIYSVKDASRVFSVAEDAIYRCAQRWNGERSVKYGDRSGMPTVPGEKEKKDMKHLLDENDPGKHGINSLTWTCTELRLHFQKNGITVFEESIRCCLRDRGTHYGRATLEYAEHTVPMQSGRRRSSPGGSSGTLMQSRMTLSSSSRTKCR